MEAIDLLDGVLHNVGGLLAGVRADQWTCPTPCPDFSTQQLVEHMIGWLGVLDAAANGLVFDGDPEDYVLSQTPERDFGPLADHLVAGWRRLGLDRSVHMTGPEMPGLMAFNITYMEYFGHGWDLAQATEQAVPFTADEAAEGLKRAEATLPADYRGTGQSFGEIVPVPEDSDPIDRLVGFLGRTP